MIPLSEALARGIATETTSLAFCWRIVRADGVALGFTTHDNDVHTDALLYRAAPGMAPSAVHLTDGLEATSMDIRGALTSDAITEADLAGGRYDGARVDLLLMDWTEPQAGTLPVVAGYLGKISHGEGGFTAEMKGVAEALDRPATELLSPECRAVLGDRRCRVEMSSRTRRTTVAEVLSARELQVTDAEPTPGGFAYGELRFLSGRNCGLGIAIAASQANLIHLAEAPAFVVTPGTRVDLREGCDRRFSTCRSRFGNAANFQGEPHMPGNDLLTRYPGI